MSNGYATTGVPVPGTVVPSGSLTSPGGGQGVQGIQGPTGPSTPSANTGNLLTAGTDSLLYLPPSAIQPTISPGLLLLSAAHNLAAADNGKYAICSGGSWTLGLPAPAIGLSYRVRNDMGITGTTGLITIQPVSGTINGAANLALLAGQEIALFTDGANWRGFGRQRVVVIGTLDITSSQANGVVLLPAGYRFFELEFTGFVPSAQDYLVGQFSNDGGTTWNTANYYHGLIYNNSATTVVFLDSENVGNFYIFPTGTTSPYGSARVMIYPGSTALFPTFRVEGTARANNVMAQLYCGGFLNVSATVNALKYFCAGGSNIANCFVTMKGAV